MRESATAPRVAIRTVGCRLNQAESAQMAASFQAAGYVVVGAAEPCDVFIVHSCTITANADADSCRLARAAARRVPRPVVVLAGCAVEAGNADALARRAEADLVAGQADKVDLPALLAARFGLPPPRAGDDGPALPLFNATRALVRVQDGCRFGCSYCIVPRTRAQFWSRGVGDTVDEVRRLHAAGYREIVLTGANLGCYRDGADNLAALLRALLADTDMPRIRLSSIESSTISDDLLTLMGNDARLCRYLHIPLQSGDDGVLQRMRRRYRAAGFRDLVARILAAMPRPGIGTDIITGFPGETDRAFAHTREMVEELPFSNLHVFPFSPRPGTDAAELGDGVPGNVARDRARELIALGETEREAFAYQFIDRDVSVLIEKTAHGAGSGWTSEYLPARVKGDDIRTNQIIRFQPAAWHDGQLESDGMRRKAALG